MSIRIYDKYGRECVYVYLVKPTLVDYVIPNYGQIDKKLWLEVAYRSYYLADAQGNSSYSTKQQMHIEDAIRFAKANDLVMISDYKLSEIYNENHPINDYF